MRWLAQGERPNFRTINRFRVHPSIDELLRISFIQFQDAFLKSGLIQGEALFIDGKKLKQMRKNSLLFGVNPSKTMKHNWIKMPSLPIKNCSKKKFSLNCSKR